MEPEGGWFRKERRYFVKHKRRPTLDLFYVRMLKRCQALTLGATIYLDTPARSVPEIKVIAAIDLGASYSGFAYCFKSDVRRVYTHQWKGKGIHDSTDKAPTTVLLHPSGEFHSFGYEAEEEYAHLVEGQLHKDWYYFWNIKTQLFDPKGLNHDSMLEDIVGKQRRAMDVATVIIKHLKTVLLLDVKSREPDIRMAEITWVVTVPTVCSAAAGEVIKEAALKAGIQNDALKLAQEFEAASVYCKTRDPADIDVISGTTNRNPLVPGSKYILVDLGGGRAEICAHVILPDNNLMEILGAPRNWLSVGHKALDGGLDGGHRPPGHEMGGRNINDEFISFMEELLGQDTMEEFATECRMDYVAFMRDFECKKRLPTTTQSHLVFELPSSLVDIMWRRHKTTLEEAVKRSEDAEHITVNANRLMIDGTIIENLHKMTVDDIISHLRQMKQNESLRDIRTVVLVGGFSQCSLVRSAIQEEFQDVTIITPPNPGTATLQGAVMLGYRPEVMVGRTAMYTYGVSFARKPFYEGKDPEELKACRNGEIYCDGFFETLVHIGQPIKWSDVFTVCRTSHMTNKESKSKCLYTKVYASSQQSPDYCTEDCACVKLGEIVREPPTEGWADVVKSHIEISFRETEILIQVHEETTGDRYKASIDYP